MRSVRKMFNQQQKQLYIDYEGVNQKSLTNYFKRVYAKEKFYNKDIADMNENELKDTLISLNIRREETRGHLLSLLRGYVNWTKYTGRSTADNVINFIKPESIGSNSSIISQMIKNPEQVNEILELAMDKGVEAQENRDNRDKLIFWLLYTGMTIEDLKSLKKTSLNYRHKTITTKNGVKYKVDANIVTLWKKCSLMTYVEKVGTLSNSGFIEYRLVDSDYLFRPILGKMYRNNECHVGIFITAILKIFKNYSEASGKFMRVSPLNIRLSGIFYRIYEAEKEGLEITHEVIAQYLGITYSNWPDLLVKTRKWYIDYENWKIAFGYM